MNKFSSTGGIQPTSNVKNQSRTVIKEIPWPRSKTRLKVLLKSELNSKFQPQLSMRSKKGNQLNQTPTFVDQDYVYCWIIQLIYPLDVRESHLHFVKIAK